MTNTYQEPKKVVVAITGASGVIYGYRLLEFLKLANVESYLIISPAAELTIKQETSLSLNDFKKLASEVHNYKDIGSKLSSGSVKTDAMVVLPCSIKTLSSITHSFDGDLITRAADVHLKERRKLILCVRETPLHLGHLRLMTQVAEYGAQIMPLVPAFYHKPNSIEDIINQSVARVCDQIGIEYPKSVFQA